jgi:hypothetical protein
VRVVSIAQSTKEKTGYNHDHNPHEPNTARWLVLRPLRTLSSHLPHPFYPSPTYSPPTLPFPQPSPTLFLPPLPLPYLPPLKETPLGFSPVGSIVLLYCINTAIRRGRMDAKTEGLVAYYRGSHRALYTLGAAACLCGCQSCNSYLARQSHAC